MMIEERVALVLQVLMHVHAIAYMSRQDLTELALVNAKLSRETQQCSAMQCKVATCLPVQSSQRQAQVLSASASIVQPT